MRVHFICVRGEENLGQSGWRGNGDRVRGTGFGSKGERETETQRENLGTREVSLAQVASNKGFVRGQMRKEGRLRRWRVTDEHGREERRF